MHVKTSITRLAVASAVAGLCVVLVGASMAAKHRAAIDLWVDPESGCDTNSGATPADALQTVNHAFQTLVDQGVAAGSTVHVVYSTTPVAPQDFGGVEQVGWHPSGSGGTPFPLRLVEGVRLVGEPGSEGEMPVITIDESSNSYTDWDRAVVVMASNSELVGFDVDGSRIASSSVQATGGESVAGVLVPEGVGMEIEDCWIRDWYTEVKVAPMDAAAVARVVIRESRLTDAWPLINGEGHAALEFMGPGSAVVRMVGGSIERSHDAFEPEPNNGATGALALQIFDTVFECNENGLELGGPYALNVEVEGAVFRNNTPHQPTVVPGAAAIALRAFEGPLAQVRVRRCVFEDYGIAVYWRHIGSNATIDLGQDHDPGLNMFCQDFGLGNDPCVQTGGDSPTQHYSVAVLQNSATEADDHSNVIHAAGNWWIPDNQGAGNDRILSGFIATGPIPRSVPFGIECEKDRNYAVELPANSGLSNPVEGVIDFGTLDEGDIGEAPIDCDDC